MPSRTQQYSGRISSRTMAAYFAAIRVKGTTGTGKRLAIGGFYPVKSSNPVIYRYLINGQQGTETAMTPLGPPAYTTFQFLIDGSTVLVPNWGQSASHPFSVLFYNFPKGGTPLEQIHQGLEYPRGVVLSRSYNSH